MNDSTPRSVPLARRVRRRLGRYLPAFVWGIGAIAAAWLYVHERPRAQAIATAEFSQVRLLTEVSGRLHRLAVEEGQSIREGEVVAMLDSRDLDERIERTRTILDQLHKVKGASADEAKL